jgi:hypothetical protein
LPQTPPDGIDPETSVRATVPMTGGGRCVLSGFPGLQTGVDGGAYIDPTQMELTVERIVHLGAELCLLLPEAEELPESALDQASEALGAVGLEVILLPIRDFEAPDAAFMDLWSALGPRLHALLNRNGTCAVSCQYGAGRSGLVTALLLIERGMQTEPAIAHVRAHFAEAVESEVQVAWLKGRGIPEA